MWWNIKSKFVQNIYFWSEIAKNACYHRRVKKLFCTNENCADKKNKCHWWCARTATPNCIIINGSSSKLFILYRFLAHGEEEEEVDKSKDCGDSKDDEEGVLVVHRSNRVSRWTIWLLGVSKSVLYFEYQYYKKISIKYFNCIENSWNHHFHKKVLTAPIFFSILFHLSKKGLRWILA